MDPLGRRAWCGADRQGAVREGTRHRLFAFEEGVAVSSLEVALLLPVLRRLPLHEPNHHCLPPRPSFSDSRGGSDEGEVEREK